MNTENEPVLEFPRVGTYFNFRGGLIHLQHGTFQVSRAEVRCNAAGKPGGRIWFTDAKSREESVTLSYYREWAYPIVIPPAPEAS